MLIKNMHTTSSVHTHDERIHVHTRSQLKAAEATWPRTKPKLARRKTQKGDNEQGPIALLGLHPTVSRVENSLVKASQHSSLLLRIEVSNL